MIRVNVLNTETNQLFGSDFETELLADSWIDAKKIDGSWGLVNDLQITKSDVSAEYLLANEINKAYLDEQFGKKIVKKLQAIVRIKQANNVITELEQLSIVEDSEVQSVERLLSQGYLASAIIKINNSQLAMFTSEEKTQIINEINSYLGV